MAANQQQQQQQQHRVLRCRGCQVPYQLTCQAMQQQQQSVAAFCCQD
jgi:hypothetical protein